MAFVENEVWYALDQRRTIMSSKRGRNVVGQVFEKLLKHASLSDEDSRLRDEIMAMSGDFKEIRRQLNFLFSHFGHPQQAVRDCAILRVAELARTDPGVIEDLLNRAAGASERVLAEIAHVLGFCEEYGNRGLRFLVALLFLFPRNPEPSRRAVQALERLGYNPKGDEMEGLYAELAKTLSAATARGTLDESDLRQIIQSK